MKKISILIPCYNEEENIVPITDAAVAVLEKDLPQYDYEIVIIDNCSQDNTRSLIRGICQGNKKIKAIFNTKNFGPGYSGSYGGLQTSGDCYIPVMADFQTPVEMIPDFVREWEKGFKFVAAIKKSSNENKIMWFIRSVFYKILRYTSSEESLDHFTGFALYDKCIVDHLRNMHDPLPFAKQTVLRLGYKRKEIPFVQPKRRAGKSSYNFFRYYDEAMSNFTSSANAGLHLATIIGFIFSGMSMLIALVYLFYKLLHWDSFNAGIAPAIIGVFFLGSLQLFFIGFIGEYIMTINTRLMNRPLVIEEERINFDDEEYI